MSGKAFRLAAGVLTMLAVLALGAGTAPKASAQTPYMYPYMGNYSPYYPMSTGYTPFTSGYAPMPSSYANGAYTGYANGAYTGYGNGAYTVVTQPQPSIVITGTTPASSYTSSYSTPSYSSSYSSPSYSSPSYSSSYNASSSYSASASGGAYGIVTNQLSATVNSSLGTIIADSRGMTLYMLSSDTSGVSTCYDTCTSVWPPALQSSDGIGTSGSFSAAFGTTTRSDGSMQITYNGKPLYFFSHDMAPGDTNGQGITDSFGHWTVAMP